MLLKDVVCLVTGGASGLGLATVSRLLKNGAKVIAVDIQEEQGNKMAEEFGKDCTFVRADVSDLSMSTIILLTSAGMVYLNCMFYFCLVDLENVVVCSEIRLSQVSKPNLQPII